MAEAVTIPEKKALLARAAGIICQASCGLVSECRSREAAAALLDAGLLAPAPVTAHQFASAYEFRGDGGDHVPTDSERAMIEDAIEGFLATLRNVDELRQQAFQLAPQEQYRLAFFIAENVGYVLAREPEHPDSPHSRPAQQTLDLHPLLRAAVEKLDNIGPSEEVGIFDGSGRWIFLATVSDLRALAALPSTPSTSQQEALGEIANRAANFMDRDAADWMPSIYKIACEGIGVDPWPLLEANGWKRDSLTTPLPSTPSAPDDTRCLEDMTLAHNARLAAIAECARVPESWADRIEQASSNGNKEDVKFLRRIEQAIRDLATVTPAPSAPGAGPSQDLFDRAIKLLKQNTGLLCESGNLNNYRNLSDEELGKAWVETAKRTAEFLNEVEGLSVTSTALDECPHVKTPANLSEPCQICGALGPWFDSGDCAVTTADGGGK